MNINTHMYLEQKTVFELFSYHNQKYIIPSYQRPYAWTEEECQTLLDDLLEFAFPSNAPFDRDHAGYFLGDITVYRNEKGEDEVVDGQQRLVSLSLLLRALLTFVEDKRDLTKCLWYTNEQAEPDSNRLKVEWNKLGGESNTQLKNILSLGFAEKKDKSTFAANFNFFQNTIKAWAPEKRGTFVIRLLENVYLVKRIATNPDEALDMFITINDRGTVLKVSDIFKAKLCDVAYAKGGMPACNDFAEYWDELSKRCDDLFPYDYKKDNMYTPIAFAFLIYAYQFQNKFNWRSLKKFYSQNKSQRLTDPKTLAGVESLIAFFENITNKEDSPFNKDTLQKIELCFNFKLPSAWYLLGLFFLKHDKSADLAADLDAFVDRMLAFYVGSAASSNLYMVTPPYKAIPSLPCLLGDVTPENWFSEKTIRHNFSDPLNNIKRAKIAQKMILSWWYFHETNAVPATTMQVEHIFSKKLIEARALSNPQLIEFFGNLALLEKTINSKAGNHRFADKKKFYLEFNNTGTANVELQRLARTLSDFTEPEILQRNESILNALLDLLKAQDFLHT